MKPRSITFISASALLLLRGHVFAEDSSITEPELVRRTQELFSAVVPGDQTPWKKYYADDCIYHDERVGASVKHS